MSEVLVIVVSAPSGAGKTSVLHRVLQEVSGLMFSVSHTTRAPRPGETDGVEYHFVDRPAFDRLIAQGAFLEWADVHGERYGTTRRELERAAAEGCDLILDVDVQGAAQVRSQLHDAVTVFVLPPSPQALDARLHGRGQDADAVILRRLEAARKEISCFEEYDYLVMNDDLEKCVEAVKSIVLAARCRRGAMEQTARRILAAFPTPTDATGGATDNR